MVEVAICRSSLCCHAVFLITLKKKDVRGENNQPIIIRPPKLVAEKNVRGFPLSFLVYIFNSRKML